MALQRLSRLAEMPAEHGNIAPGVPRLEAPLRNAERTQQIARGRA